MQLDRLLCVHLLLNCDNIIIMSILQVSFIYPSYSHSSHKQVERVISNGLTPKAIVRAMRGHLPTTTLTLSVTAHWVDADWKLRDLIIIASIHAKATSDFPLFLFYLPAAFI
jgi:hypothetical protein